MEATNTYIQWPSRMKIGAKTKKDLYVRVYGHNPDDVNEAKAQILADFGPHRVRIFFMSNNNTLMTMQYYRIIDMQTYWEPFLFL